MTLSAAGVQRRRTALQHRALALCLILNVLIWGVLAFVPIFKFVPTAGVSSSILLQISTAGTGLGAFTYFFTASSMLRLVPEVTPRRSLVRTLMVCAGLIPIVQVIPSIIVCKRMVAYWRELGLFVRWRGPAWRQLKWLKQDGHCFGCGYNMEGNRSGICPECGSGVRQAAP